MALLVMVTTNRCHTWVTGQKLHHNKKCIVSMTESPSSQLRHWSCYDPLGVTRNSGTPDKYLSEPSLPFHSFPPLPIPFLPLPIPSSSPFPSLSTPSHPSCPSSSSHSLLFPSSSPFIMVMGLGEHYSSPIGSRWSPAATHFCVIHRPTSANLFKFFCLQLGAPWSLPTLPTLLLRLLKSHQRLHATYTSHFIGFEHIVGCNFLQVYSNNYLITYYNLQP